MKQGLKTVKVILMLARLQISSAMMYRASFWGAFFVDLSFFLIQLLFFNVISQNGNIGDWNIYHLTVFVGTFTALDGLYMATYFFGILSLPDKIRTGTLDLVIVKPVNTLLYTTFDRLNLGSLVLFGVGLGITAYGGAKLGVLTMMGCLQFFIVFMHMVVLMYALMLGLRCTSFWLTKISVLDKVEGVLVDFSIKLPSPAIHGAWKILLFIVLPYGLMANMPSQALFNRFGLRQWSLVIGVTAFFLFFSRWLWHLGRKKYDSASS